MSQLTASTTARPRIVQNFEILIKMIALPTAVGETGGGSPGEQGSGRGTGDGRRKGGRRDLYDGGKRERNSKRQAFPICYCLLPVKEKNPRTFLDFHLTFS